MRVATLHVLQPRGQREESTVGQSTHAGTGIPADELAARRERLL